MFVFTLTVFIIILYIFLKLCQKFLNSKDNFWPKLGVPLIQSNEFASFLELFLGQKSLEDLECFYYKKFPLAPIVGYMEIRTPSLLLRDLDIIKNILDNDFNYFVNRRKIITDYSLMNKFLYNMRGQEWKETRMIMTPSVTTHQNIRRIFQHLDNSGQNLVTHILSNIDCSEGQGGKEYEIELRDFFDQYMTDVISSTVFGWTGDSEFMKMSRKFQEMNLLNSFKLIFVLLLPNIARVMRISLLHPEATSYFSGIMRKSMDRKRQTEETGHTDFSQLLLDARDMGMKMTDDKILANCLGFISAGFDTTSSVLSFTVYYLAIYPEFQSRVREEIEGIVEGEGEVTYEGVCRMTFLDMFVSEVCRLHPPYTRTERRVTIPYKVPGTEVILPVDTIVGIPIWSIQHDPKYWPDPENFDPERFFIENCRMRHSYAFLPFGRGPRSCLGMRFAMTSVKTGIAHLLLNFDIFPCRQTLAPIKVEIVKGMLRPDKKVKVRLKSRVNNESEQSKGCP